MENKQKIIIGIPAYNEENILGKLLDSLNNQNLNDSKISEIIVCSDASTDNTEKIVLKKRKIKTRLLINKNRKGQAHCQNEIIKAANCDVLVLLNADIVIDDKDAILKLIEPVINHRADLTSCRLKGMPTNSKVGALLNFSIDFKNYLYETYKNGRNIYTCHGPIRAFSKKLYKEIKFIESIGEDAYSYLFCLIKGYKYQYVKNVSASIISPNNLKDHIAQSSRFNHSEELMKELFSPQIVKKEYAIPKKYLISTIGYFLIRQPLKTISYIVLFFFLRLRSMIITYDNSQIWTISKSSKSLNI